MSNITLSASMRTNLLALQNTQKLMDTTQERLSTGLKVNSAIDNASSYYTAASLNNRASDLSSLLDNMGQGIQTIKAANEGIEAITSFVEQAKAAANSARDMAIGVKETVGEDGTVTYALDANTQATRDGYAAQFNKILEQIDGLAKDAGYKGTNLLKGNDLTVYFNENRDSSIVVEGVKATSDADGLNLTKLTLAVGTTPSSWGAATQTDGVVTDTGMTAIETSITQLDKAMNTLRSWASDFGNYYALVETRQNFTENLINVLTEGADNLTLADMNEESANMLALQTRQQLGANSLSLASISAQSVLKLF